MKRSISCAALSTLLLATVLLRADEAEPAAKWELEGRWKVVALESEGAPSDVPDETWVFDRGALTIHRNMYRRATQLTYREKADAAPKQFDWSRERQPKEPVREPDLGIYRIKDGKLQLCYSSTRGVRPKEFATKRSERPTDPGSILYTFERVKE